MTPLLEHEILPLTKQKSSNMLEIKAATIKICTALIYYYYE